MYAIELESMHTECLPHVRPAFLSKRFNQSHVWASPLEVCCQQRPLSRNTMAKNNQTCIIYNEDNSWRKWVIFCSTCHFFLWPLMAIDGGCGGAMVGGCLVETVNVKTRSYMKTYQYILHLKFHPHPNFRRLPFNLWFFMIFLSLQISNKWWLE